MHSAMEGGREGEMEKEDKTLWWWGDYTVVNLTKSLEPIEYKKKENQKI